jgi:hypothetical protein
VNQSFATEDSISAANANSLQPTQFWQRIRVSLHNTQLGSECQFAAEDSISAANAILLQRTQFWQRIRVSLHNTQLGSEC